MQPLGCLRMKVCRFSAIRTFFSADCLINQEATRLCWDTHRHTDRLSLSLCLSAGCNGGRLVTINHCFFLQLMLPLQTNKQPDSLLRTTDTATVIKTPNNEPEVACFCVHTIQFTPLLIQSQLVSNYPVPVYKRSSSSGRDKQSLT